MKLGIMQPYFFPHLAHFALISAVDEWIVFDITQYTRKSWINRNRVLHPDDGWQYVSIRLLNSSIHIKILEAEVASPRSQERYVLGKISHCRRHAPYYAQVCDIVRTAFAGIVDDRLVSLNVSGLRAVCEYLGLKFRYRLCSQLALDYPDGLRDGQWAPWIAAKLSADVYVNPIGGRALSIRRISAGSASAYNSSTLRLSRTIRPAINSKKTFRSWTCSCGAALKRLFGRSAPTLRW